MKARLLLALLLPLAARAQLTLFVLNGATETPLGATFDFGKVAVGDTKDVLFRAHNTSSSPLPVTTLALSGAGFTLVNTPSPPFAISAGNFVDLKLHFAAGIVATYSANFQMNSVSVLVLAASVAVATLSAAIGCSGPDPATGTIGFGTILSPATSICTLSLRNRNSQSITVSTLTSSGAGFGSPQGIRTPFTLLAGENVNFTLAFAPGSPGSYSGTLIIDSRTFPLSAIAIAPTLAAPAVGYESSPLQSAQQRKLTLSLATPAPVAVAGDVTLSFTPDTALVKDDPTVVFAATGGRSVVFTIRQAERTTLGNLSDGHHVRQDPILSIEQPDLSGRPHHGADHSTRKNIHRHRHWLDPHGLCGSPVGGLRQHVFRRSGILHFL